MNTLGDLARVSTPTTGTGTVTLGGPVAGYLTFAQAGVPDGSTVSYGIADGANSETGSGTYSGGTLTRSVYRSTAAGNTSPISLSGAAQVFVTALSSDFGSLALPEDWADITGKPATFPPTLPIAQTGVSNLVTDLAAKAPLVSPVFTGDPRAPTPAAADNDTSIATTAYVKSQNYLTGNQTITLSGAVSGSGTTSIETTLATVPITAGGTGSTTAPAALTALGAVARAGDSMSGQLTVQAVSGVANIVLRKADAADSADLVGTSPAGTARWVLALADGAAETGTGNTGSGFSLHRFTDAGAYIGAALTISRATGNAVFDGAMTAAKATATGASASIGFDDRTGGGAQNWNWYATDGAARFYSAEMGADRLTILSDGSGYFTGRVAAGSGIGSADAIVSAGSSRTADGHAYVDFYAQGSAGFSARLLRSAGVNGSLALSNNGTGSLLLQIAGGYNGQIITSTGDSTFYSRICVGTSTPGGLVGSAGAINSHSQYIDGVLIHGSARQIELSLGRGEPLPFTGLDPSPADDETCLSLMVNRGGRISLQKVVLGAPDSGGPGLRALCVSNDAAGHIGRPAPEGWGLPGRPGYADE